MPVKRQQLFIFVFLIINMNTSIANEVSVCPPMPEAVTSTSRDIKSEISGLIGVLGKIKAGEVAVKTEIEVKNLFNKYPNVDKLLALQTMSSTYCNMLNNINSIPEIEKIDRWEKFQEKVLDLKPVVDEKVEKIDNSEIIFLGNLLKVPLLSKTSEVNKYIDSPNWNTAKQGLILSYQQKLFGESFDVYENFEGNVADKAEMFKDIEYGWQTSNFIPRPTIRGSESEVNSYCDGNAYHKFLSNLITKYGKPVFSGEPETIDISQEVQEASGRCQYPSWNTCTKSGTKIIKHHEFKLDNEYILAWDVTAKNISTEHTSHRDNVYSSLKNLRCFWKLTVSKNTPLSLKFIISSRKLG